MRLIHIDKGKTRYSMGTRTTTHTIKQLLLANGLTEKQIKQMQAKNLILTSVGNLGRGVKSRDELYYVDLEEPCEPPKTLDRFKDL